MSSALLVTQARNELVRRVVAVDPPKNFGRPRSLTITQTLDKIMYICRTGCQWSQLPTEGMVSYKTVYHRFSPYYFFFSDHRSWSQILMS